MGKSIMYAVFVKGEIEPVRFRIIDNNGNSRFTYLGEIRDRQSCFMHNCSNKYERIEARKTYDDEINLKMIKLFSFYE